MMAHNFNNTAAVMALSGVTQFIDSFHSGIHGRIITNGVLTAGNIVVDGAGQTNARNSLICQRTGAHERTVTTDNHQGIDSQFFAAGKAFGLTFLGLEFQATGCIQNSTTRGE